MTQTLQIEQLQKLIRNPHKEQKLLQRKAKERITLLLGGKDTLQYKENSKSYFREMWQEFRNKFGVDSYWDTSSIDFDAAVVWIGEWLPKNGEKGESQ